MFARVATFEGINVEAAQSSMEEAEAIIRPILSGLPGYKGALELANQDGKFLSVTLFVGRDPDLGRSLHGGRRRSHVAHLPAPGSVRRHGEELG